ncbi:HNH endonuclease [Acanthopleuribacter pedis]|uniref:HNH endonuclease n=1 Tax=Acanthopleuribacter pedis TaxID=442870 RepID=A0A8J7QK12_9BACT|nr:HNH endonuclease [Acanthopleuribacter pedis]MBO1321425.1 HNH endonuclease [Acanthopleuribacter pedis]
METNGAVVNAKENIISWYKDGRGGKPPTPPDHWNGNNARGALIARQGLFCAYCQVGLKLICPTTTVDHFRPQRAGEEDDHQGYLWLAFDWSNLYLVCDTCNKAKGTYFPLLDPAQRVAFSNRDDIDQEEPLLLDPSEPFPPDLVTLKLCDSFPFLLLEVNPNHPGAARATATISKLRLHGMGRTEWLKHRKKAVDKLFESLEKKREQGNSGPLPPSQPNRTKPDPQRRPRSRHFSRHAEPTNDPS